MCSTLDCTYTPWTALTKLNEWRGVDAGGIDREEQHNLGERRKNKVSLPIGRDWSGAAEEA